MNLILDETGILKIMEGRSAGRGRGHPRGETSWKPAACAGAINTILTC